MAPIACKFAAMALEFKVVSPRAALSKIYLRQTVAEADVERLRSAMQVLLDSLSVVAEQESEEHIKNLFGAFLKQVWYQDYYVNTSGRIDLAIAAGPKPKDPVAVIIEAKRPTNTEFPTPERTNTKALHELLLYYLRERENGNNQIRNLILTNGWCWYLLDENWLDKQAWHNKSLVADFRRYEKEKRTEDFYRDVAGPFFNAVTEPLPLTFIDLRDYRKLIDAPDLLESSKSDEQQQVAALYKVLSPQHLLKLSLGNDSNSLNQEFYSELLHILGLEEVKESNKLVIKRLPKGKREDGSLMELALFQIVNRNRLRTQGHVFYPELDGDEKLFAIGIELVITWINRILFLKLLEGQLVSIHKHHPDKNKYLILNKEHVKDIDELAKLFFDVLAKKPEDRHPRIAERFGHIPYLNSSLFEETPLEEQVLEINQLDDHTPLALHHSTVLKDGNGKRATGEIYTLDYLFRFLDAYDFGAESTGEIRPKSKTLINASVLGLIFEKINGYKEGSVYTPGYITMFMCREAIRKTVVQKFNSQFGWNVSEFDDLPNHLSGRSRQDILAYNDVVNSVKVCDPAVGSGHFLVSALNEILACKSDLGILADDQGNILRDWKATVENDELLVTNLEGKLFDYAKQPSGKVLETDTLVQKTIFHEKQLLIENSLFGVDINPNSVKICRLRLWIELLKNAYYKPETKLRDLETLPNIDINIKAGNSLLSRFSLREDLSDVFRNQRFSLSSYRDAVKAYKSTRSWEAKDELVAYIKQIKDEFKKTISKRDPRIKKLSELRGERTKTEVKKNLFNEDIWPSEEVRLNRQRELDAQIAEKETELNNEETNHLFSHGFEWRFEFPEVLDDEGNYHGFDLVVGNPPYIRQEELGELKKWLIKHYTVGNNTADLLVYFFELGTKISIPSGNINFITSNKFMKAKYGQNLRAFLKDKNLTSIVDFGELPVFASAATFPAIYFLTNEPPVKELITFSQVKKLDLKDSYYNAEKVSFELQRERLSAEEWLLLPEKAQYLINKMRANGKDFGKIVGGQIKYGIKTGLNEAFVINTETRNRIIAADPKASEIIKPLLLGDSVRRCRTVDKGLWLIFTRHGIEIENYPSVLSHLQAYQERLEPRPKSWSGRIWPGRKIGYYKWYEVQDSIDYWENFEQPKLIWPVIAKEPRFTIDYEGYYSNDKTFISPVAHPWLLALLNSKVVWFYLKAICSVLGDPEKGGRLELRSIYVSTIPIVEPTDSDNQHLTKLVTQILQLKKQDPVADTTVLEAEIDQVVYRLYGLNEDEIRLVEEAQQ